MALQSSLQTPFLMRTLHQAPPSVDGSEIRRENHLGWKEPRKEWDILPINWLAGFLPSTVVLSYPIKQICPVTITRQKLHNRKYRASGIKTNIKMNHETSKPSPSPSCLDFWCFLLVQHRVIHIHTAHNCSFEHPMVFWVPLLWRYTPPKTNPLNRRFRTWKPIHRVQPSVLEVCIKYLVGGFNPSEKY